MKTLILVRHAKSSWKFPELSDHDRPLNKRGRKNAPEMGKRFADKNIKIDAILSSSAKRALDTARVFQKTINFTRDIDIRKKFFHAYPQTILNEIRSLDNSVQSVMVFGHNPGVTELANELTHSKIQNIPTTGMVIIELPIEHWNQLNFGMGKLIEFDYPKKITK